MKTRIALILIAALVVFGAIFAIKAIQNKNAQAAQAAMMPEPPTVSTMIAKADAWSSSLSSVATLSSSESIMVCAEIPGIVRRIVFTSGSDVKAGDMLIELDTSTEEAQLQGLEAAARLAQLSLQRAQDLRAKGTNSQADLDQAEATNSQTLAAANELKAVIAKKRITAPFSGKLGIRKVSTGQFITSDNPIVELESCTPIYADFTLPQQDVTRVSAGLAVTLTVDSYPDREFTGKVEAVNARVGDSTRSVMVRAIFENADQALKSGMFGSISLGLAGSSEVVVVPATAIVYSSYGNFVYVIKPGPKGMNMVEQQFVVLGAKRGDQVAVLKGVKAGDQVVSSGQIKLRNGIPVRINNSVLPDNNPAPKPSES